MKLFVEVDVVVIVPALVLHYRASFSFYVSLFSWRLKTTLSLTLIFSLPLSSLMLKTTLSFTFIFCMSFFLKLSNEEKELVYKN